VVLGGHREVGAADLPGGHPEPVKRLRRGDLVYEVQIDVEEIGFALGGAHDVPVPDLLADGSRRHWSILAISLYEMLVSSWGARDKRCRRARQGGCDPRCARRARSAVAERVG